MLSTDVCFSIYCVRNRQSRLPQCSCNIISRCLRRLEECRNRHQGVGMLTYCCRHLCRVYYGRMNSMSFSNSLPSPAYPGELASCETFLAFGDLSCHGLVMVQNQVPVGLDRLDDLSSFVSPILYVQSCICHSAVRIMSYASARVAPAQSVVSRYPAILAVIRNVNLPSIALPVSHK